MTNKVFVIKEFEVERRSIPLAIQTYFWRQSSQFLKPKLNRRSCESASVSLQRLICENRVQDLQPSLANAVLSVPRWFFVQASLPHVLAGVSALMANRYELGLVERLGNAEREMLYTMHWILVEAFNHCEVAYEESLLYPLATVELFVRLLSPHAFKIRDNDLIFRLGNGISLWKPLWTYQSPELPPFATAVIFKDQENDEDSRVPTSAEDGSHSVRNSTASGRSVRKSDLDPFGKKLFSPATFFDVAVLKCLCSTGLCEEGLIWILKYILAYLKREFLMQEDEIPEENENGLETQEQDVSVKIPSSELKTDTEIEIGEGTKNSNFAESSGGKDNGNKKETSVFAKPCSEVRQPEEQKSQEEVQDGQRKGSGTKLRVRMDSPVLSGHDGGRVFTPIVSSIRSSSPDPNDNIHLIVPSTCGASIEFSLSPVPPTSVTIVNETDNNNVAVTTSSAGQTLASPYTSSPTSEGHSVQNVVPLLGTSAGGPEFITVTAPSTPTDTSQESTGNMGDFQPDIAYVLEEDPDVHKYDEEISSILTSSDSNIESSVCVTPLSSFGDSPQRTSRVPLASPDVDSTDASLGSVSLISAESSATTNATQMTVSLDSDDVNFESHAAASAGNSHNFVKGENQAGKGFGRNRRSSGVAGSNRSSFAKTEKYYVYPGAAEYITNDGRLSILVILQALHGVLRDNPTGCVCEEVLNVLNCLIEINEKSVKRCRRSSWVSQDDRTVAETMVCGWKTPQSDSVLGRLRPSFYGRPPSFQSLVFGCIFRLVKALGCPLGCGESLCLTGDKLRSDSIATLDRTVETQLAAAESWITNYVRLDPVEDVVDLLHALLGFCEDPEMSDEEDEDTPSKTGLFSTKAGVEGKVVGFLLKTLVSRTAETSLQSLASLTLYGELRQMLKFVKDVYGGIFWKVALSGLRDCAFKDNKKNIQATHENKEAVATTGRPVEREVSFKGSSSIVTPKTVKKRFFHQKFGKGMDGSDVEGGAGSSSGVSPKVTATGLSLEDTLSPKTKRKIFSLGTWRKKNIQGSTAELELEEDEMFDQTMDSSKEKSSSLKRTFLIKSQSSRKKLEEVFQLKANFKRKDPLQTPETPEAAQGIDIFVQEVEKKPVDVSALRAGMVRLRFLGNALQPGSVPDPQIVASMLDLEAPVIARAALLLECAFLVHRCNTGDWPTWIRGSHTSLAHRARSKGPTPTTTRRSLAAMHEAGLLFHSWGVALGLKLEYMLAKKQNPALDSIQEDSEKSFLAQLGEQMDEDYLDEATIQEHNKVCPYALKMIACHLLLEITAFLRESHGLYSVTKDNSRLLQRRAAQSRKSVSFPEKRRTLQMGNEQNRLSAFFGGGDRLRKASIWSQTSTTTATEMSTSPAGRYSHYEPPTITVSDQGVGDSGSASALEHAALCAFLGPPLITVSDHEASDIGSAFAVEPIASCAYSEPPVITVSDQETKEGGLTIPMRKRSVEERMDRVAEGLHVPRNRGSLFVPRTATISGHYSPRAPRSTKFPTSGGDGEAPRFKSRKGASTKKQRTTTESTIGGGSGSEDEDERKHFPWMNAIVLLNSSTIFLCGHQENCPYNCHFRQSQSCRRLLKALRTVYSDPSDSHQEKEKVVDFSRGTSRNIVHSGAPHLGLSQHASPKLERRKEKKDKADENMLEYMSAKLSSLTHIPFSVIAKAGVVVDRELLIDTLPVVWEVLLDGDQHLVSAAAAVFLLTGIRLPAVVEQLLFKELTCNDPGDRVKSLIRYEVLWQSRYHAWPRLEECAKQLLKLPPPRVDFTQPSPPVGVAVPHAPDSPWDANMILEEQQGKKNKDKKKVKEADLEEERRKQRSCFPLRTVPVALEATVAANVSTDEAGAAIPQSEERELWPSSLSSAVPHIIKLLDDVLVDSDKVAVMEGAYRVIWNCLVDNPVLFFRTILEQITKKDKQEEQIILLRKLSMFLPEMPPGAARFVFNSLVGVVMFYARTRKPGNKDPVALVLSLLWELAPSVKGLYFKDLKQCLKKEHCDASLMISANVPGTKKLAVSYAAEDSSLERVPVHDEMTFGKVLQYYKARLNLDATDLVLIDKQSNMLLEEEQFVRDVYSHRKGFPSPHLKLEHMGADKAFYKRQQQAFTFKLGDIGRILLSTSILKTLSDQKHIWFLHGEFSRQISFPRNALHCDFHLYVGGSKGKELFALDVIHKGLWVKLVAILFQHMSSTFQWGSADLQLFLNVINGATLLHCEDGAVLRLCLVSFINIAVHFNQIFATDGYQYIFPTLLQVYAHHQTNEMVCQAIEFVVSQFYILHQKPCLLQLFASVATHLLLENRNDMESEREGGYEGKVPPRVLFKLLLSLDRPTPDVLELMDWVRAEKPLKPIDSCYEGKLDSPEESKVDIAIRLCVTVVDYAPDSKRASQMVIVMSAILPYYLEHLKQESVVSENTEKIQTEVEAITSLATSMQVLIKSSDILTRSFTHFETYKAMSDAERSTVPQETFGSTGSLLFSRGSVSSYDLGNDEEEGGMSRRPLVERIRSLEEKDETMEALYEYRKPRNALLILVSDYVSICTRRVEELRRATGAPRFVSLPELLDDISIGVLAEIVYSLMKLAIYDPITMSCNGIQRYLLEALPVIDWAPEAAEPGINLILKRMNKIFTKLVNKPELMRNIDWHALEVYLRGVYLALCRQSFVANSQYLKSLVSTCMSMVLQERPSTATSISASLPWCPFFEPPKFFSATVVKLSARLMCSLRDACTLKEVCGGTTSFGGPARTEKVFLRVLLPLLVRLGTGKHDTPKISPEDLFYALSCFLRVITTKNSSSPGSPPTRLSLAYDDIDLTRPLTFVSPDLTGASVDSIPDSLYTAAYLGIKLLMVNFEDLLASEYYRIFQAVEKVVDNNMGCLPFWDFVHFTVSHRTPLSLMLVPLIHTKLMAVSHKTGAETSFKQRILEKVHKPQLVVCCRKAFTERFLDELAALRENRAVLEKEEEDRPNVKPLVLNPPPRGRLDSEQKSGTSKTSAPDEQDAAAETQAGEIKQQDSLKIKKTVTFSQKPQESSSAGPKSPTPSAGGTEKRRKRLLFKQHPLESSVEQGKKGPTVDSLDSPFGHQRGTTMRGKPKLSSRAPYRIGARFKRGAAACVTSGKEGSEEEPWPDAALLGGAGDVVIEMKEIVEGEAAPVPQDVVLRKDAKIPEVASVEANPPELPLPKAEKTETKLQIQEMKQQILDHTENKLNDEDEKLKSYTDIVALIGTSYKETAPNEHDASDMAGLTYKDVQMSMSRFVSRTHSKKSTDSDRSADSETRLLDSPQGDRRTSNGPAAPSRLSLSSSFVSDKSDSSTNRLRPWHRLYSSGDLWRTKLSSGPSTSSEDCTSEDLVLDYVSPNRYIAVKLSPETDV